MERYYERLDFSFSNDDLEKIKEMYFLYIKSCFENIEDDKYLEKYVILPKGRDDFKNSILEDLYLLKEFFDRKYEIFTLDNIKIIVDKIKENLIFEDIEDTETFLKNEEKRLYYLERLFNDFENTLNDTAKLDLSSFAYDVYKNTLIYFLENTDKFILEQVAKFIDIINEKFLPYLSQLDKIVICDPEYLDYVAGGSCFAYYIDGDVFIPSEVEDKYKDFFIETIYHEFGHFVYYLIPAYMQIEWTKEYSKWLEKDYKFTREPDEEMDLYELFADCFAICYSPLQESLKSPEKEVIEFFKKLMKKVVF